MNLIENNYLFFFYLDTRTFRFVHTKIIYHTKQKLYYYFVVVIIIVFVFIFFFCFFIIQ